MPTESELTDYYELLQISPNAEPETIHRVYRLLAQRFHPDNRDTGNTERFHQLSEAYQVLSDPERRAASTTTLVPSTDGTIVGTTVTLAVTVGPAGAGGAFRRGGGAAPTT